MSTSQGLFRGPLVVFLAAASCTLLLGWLAFHALSDGGSRQSEARAPRSIAGTAISAEFAKDANDAALKLAESQMRRSQTTLDTWLDQHFENWLAEPTRDVSLSIDNTSGRSAASLAPSVQLNPQWAELTNQLATLQRLRADYVERYTAEHPDLKKLEVDVAELRDRIANTAQYLDRVDNARAPPEFNAATRPDSQEIAARIAERRSNVETYRGLKSAAVENNENLHRLHSAQIQSMRERLQEAAGRMELLQQGPIAVAQPQSQSTPWLWLAVLALFVGGAVTALVVQRDEPMRNIADIQNVLQLPVVATLPVRYVERAARMSA